MKKSLLLLLSIMLLSSCANQKSGTPTVLNPAFSNAASQQAGNYQYDYYNKNLSYLTGNNGSVSTAQSPNLIVNVSATTNTAPIENVETDSLPNISAGEYVAPQTAATTSQNTDSSGISQNPANYNYSQKTNIAVLLPMSGKNKSIGNDLKDSIFMALYDTKRNDLNITVYDTQANPTVAQQQAQQAVANGANVIIGPLFASCVNAVSPVAQANNIKVFSFTTDDSTLKPGVHSINFLKKQEIDSVLAYAATQGLQKIIFLSPNNEYAKVAQNYITTSGSKYGQTLSLKTYKEGDQKDLERMIAEVGNNDVRKKNFTDLKNFLAGKPGYSSIKYAMSKKSFLGTINADAVFLLGNQNEVLSMTAFMAFYDISKDSVQILGLSNLNDPKITQEYYFKNALFSTPNENNKESFEARFKETYGRNPVKIASTAYDLLYLVSLSSANGSISDSAIYNPSGFLGFSGLFRFLPNAISERIFEIDQIEGKDKTIMVQPAPKTFSIYYEYLNKKLESERAIKANSTDFFGQERTMWELKDNINLLKVSDLDRLKIK